MIEHRERTVNGTIYCMDGMLFTGTYESYSEAIEFQNLCKKRDIDVDFIIDRGISGRQILTTVCARDTIQSIQNFPPCILALFYIKNIITPSYMDIFYCKKQETKEWKLDLSDLFINHIEEYEKLRRERAKSKSLLTRIKEELFWEG